MSNNTSAASILLEVRDGDVDTDFVVTESGSYSRFPAEVRDNPELSFGARLTYSMLVGFAIDSNRVYPGQQLLADRLGVTPRSVRTYIDELRTNNLLRVDRRGLTKTNVYILAVWINNNANPDRKHASGPDRKHASGLERKHTSYNNEETDNYESDNDENKDAHARPSVSRSKLNERAMIRESARQLKRAAHLDKVQAVVIHAGIQYGSLTERQTNDWVDAFASSPIPLEDIGPVVRYLLSQPWYSNHRERLTAKAVVRVWPGWIASGRPTSERGATSQSSGANTSAANQRDESQRALAQKIADDRGEVFNGVAPSYWTTGGK